MTELSDIKVIDLGGSLVVPDRIDTDFLKAFARTLTGYLSQDEARKVILVCGGGTLAREYQKAYREVAVEPQNEAQDWIGITATRLNAELLKQLFSSYCPLPVITDPTDVTVFAGRILIAGGGSPDSLPITMLLFLPAGFPLTSLSIYPIYPWSILTTRRKILTQNR